MNMIGIGFMRRQQGAATLIVVMVLSIVMGGVALTTARTGVMEQQIVGNDLRAREAQEAAEAGLEYGLAWAKSNTIPNNVTCAAGSLPNGCPSALPPVVGTSTGESYNYLLTFTKGSDAIRVTSVSQGSNDASITAQSEAWVKQIRKSLFGSGMTMPPPLAASGCITGTKGGPTTYLLGVGNLVAASGTSASSTCLPQGHMNVNLWDDANNNGVLDTGETGVSDNYNVGTFPGCPGTECAWNNYFEMSLSDAKQEATDAGHVYTSIPCGPPNSAPSIYVVNNSGPINSSDITGSCSGVGIDNRTIGGPNNPVLLIIPSGYGCPKFNGSIRVYGVIYYETATDCATNGFGGAEVYGAILIEGDADKFNANTKFIEVDHGSGDALNDIFQMSVDDATRIPGTWKDF
ncbi:pilus assembly PilX family protein [Methylotuvimicrobium alcaliphilum]|uniref:Type 4 fimbrial biogenesis protein PilX N-terminal domain-containing protein n=1 Tax=Methylotuvimicrobium alcaliphilum (strain DSM 19304 / NCIMB 14124 / VKM B-2133 / 20Z) TaxID=1091494 RepID=G4ST42_META2|nr:PilX N-terminal domain-containing pilus assembly protein [Methylotuvimicrobium alcaliphilum]CCE22752.1 protein of unknown function [Methylotuvimicrobium alcaliphilum 20Z]